MKKWQLILLLLNLENLAIASEQARAVDKAISDFICSYEGCGIKFTTKYSLIKHRVAHIGKWPYACGACGITFTKIGSLNKHKRLFHAQKASADKKRPRDADIVEFEDPGLLDDFLFSGGAVGVDGLASADLGLDNASVQSLFDDHLEDI